MAITPAFPANDCGSIEVEAIEWPYLDELTDCIVAAAPAPIYDCPDVPYPAPVPRFLRGTAP